MYPNWTLPFPRRPPHESADLDILLQEGEGVMLEYKERVSASLAREMAAFANTAGGRILLGVRIRPITRCSSF